MLRDSVATESIYGFAQKQANAQPSEESVFVLTSSQLEEIVAKSAQDVLESPKDLRQIVLDQAREIRVLNAKLEAMQKDMDSLAENQLIQLRLINDLRKGREPQPLQKDRGEILRALLAANGGKMLAKDARLKMHLSRSAFSQLLSTLKDKIEIKPYHLRKNQKLLVLKPCLVKQ